MSIIELLSKELEQEAEITRKMLGRVPNDKWDWKPHQKSMTMMNLTTHVAELPGWIAIGLNSSGIDFAEHPYEPAVVHSTSEVMDIFEKALDEGRGALRNAKEEDLLPQWTLRNGDQIYSVMTKYEVIRHSLAQSIHHRAQLGVYLRLLDIPIPGSYGPSADDVNG